MIYFPVKSLPNPANPYGISRYKIRKNNSLYFQHLRHPLASAHSKGTSTPADSTLTRPLSLTPLESTLTRKQGEGVVLASLIKNPRNSASLLFAPSALYEGLPRAPLARVPTLCLSLPRAKRISLLFNRLRTLRSKLPRCTPFGSSSPKLRTVD